jgi:hypothetical protein
MKKYLLLPLAIYLTSAFVCPNGFCRPGTPTNVGTHKFGIQLDLKSGSLDFLKQEKQVNLEYVYDGMKVGILLDRVVEEKEYVTNKVAELNQKQVGRGDHWRNEWIYDRAARFEPKFNGSM